MTDERTLRERHAPWESMTGAVRCAWCGNATYPCDTAKALALLDEARRERDLAVAHDRQPYPTAAAYERVCALLEAERKTVAALREALRLERTEAP